MSGSFISMQETLHTESLQLAYEERSRHSEIIIHEENARQLRLKIILLEDANCDLHDQLEHDDNSIDELEKSSREMQNQLDAVETEAERLRGEMRMKLREVDNLRAELESLQGVSMETTKLLTEKLALSRELATLRPELEHLRSQAASNQSLLAEKLSLQRQLSTAQVELETERRAIQRSLSKEGGRQAQDAKLEVQLDSLQSELSKERRERQRIERDAQKISIEFEGKKTILESRLDAFRNKLKVTKDKLKEAQVELQSARNSMAVVTDKAKGPPNSRKRSLAQMDTDAAIGTPGLQPAAKKTKRGSNLPGDKSTFSITPFLNRTASLAPESPNASVEATAPRDNIIEELANTKDEKVGEETPSGKVAKKLLKNKAEPRKKLLALGTSKASKSNVGVVPAGRKARVSPALAQVQEEDMDENQPPTTMEEATAPEDLLTKPIEKIVGVQRGLSEEPTFIKKKRKVLGGGLGRTLFDDDDDAKPSRASDHVRGVRDFATSGKAGLGKLKMARFGSGNSAGFGAFSPLKKERKTLAL